MPRVYNKKRRAESSKSASSEPEEITSAEALKILERSQSWFITKRKENLIAPVAKYGNEFLYAREDVVALREMLTIRF